MHLLVLFVHLLATCTALGTILASDVHLLTRLGDYRSGLTPPGRFVARMVGLSLFTLCASGAVLIGIGLDANPDYLANPKLQVKLALVATLALNAFVLHAYTFPRLTRGGPLNPRSVADLLGIGVPVALSNTLWLYCAFLGIARTWNKVVPATEVLGFAAMLFGFTLAAVMLTMALAGRDRPHARRADWIDRLKLRLHAAQRRPAVARPVRTKPPGARPPDNTAHFVPNRRPARSPRPGAM
jgi:hypothetical protein